MNDFFLKIRLLWQIRAMRSPEVRVLVVSCPDAVCGHAAKIQAALRGALNIYLVSSKKYFI